MQSGLLVPWCKAVQNAPMDSPPTPNVRLTISVSSEVHATFQRLAKGSGMSISKAMGEWLGDTIEAAEFMASKIEQARAAPKIVMQEMHAYALGLADETGALMETLREKGRTDRAQAAEDVGGTTPVRSGRSVSPRTAPPSSNTGGKPTGKKHDRPGTVGNRTSAK